MIYYVANGWGEGRRRIVSGRWHRRMRHRQDSDVDECLRVLSGCQFAIKTRSMLFNWRWSGKFASYATALWPLLTLLPHIQSNHSTVLFFLAAISIRRIADLAAEFANWLHTDAQMAQGIRTADWPGKKKENCMITAAHGECNGEY